MNIVNEPLICLNMTETAFNQDVLILRKRARDSMGELISTVQQYIELRREDLPALLDALRQSFGELP